MPDTIFALSSGALPAGIAIVRISGPATREIIGMLCGALPAPGSAVLRDIVSVNGALLDRGLVLFRAGPRSYTGEDLCEIHLHGSRAVVAALFAELRGAGARMAEAGEFTRRAFGNGRIDLSASEGLVDLLAAETEAQRRQALAQAGGALRDAAERWRDEIVGLRAEIEARLDFADEADVPEPLPVTFSARLAALQDELRIALAGYRRAEQVRNGFRVVILGPPNAGKSSLLNALARRDAAIVTAEPGTTRDVVEVKVDLNGYPVILSDTAGLRDAVSEAERIGIERATEAAATADLVIWLSSVEDPTEPPVLAGDIPVFAITSKADLAVEPPVNAISSATGQGIEALVREIETFVSSSETMAEPLVTRERQRIALAEALNALSSLPEQADEVAADLLRQAGTAMGRISGRVDVEEVLDRVFAEFCIGK